MTGVDRWLLVTCFADLYSFLSNCIRKETSLSSAILALHFSSAVILLVLSASNYVYIHTFTYLYIHLFLLFKTDFCFCMVISAVCGVLSIKHSSRVFALSMQTGCSFFAGRRVHAEHEILDDPDSGQRGKPAF